MKEQIYKIEENDILLRIFISEKEKHQGKNLAEVIVNKAREIGIAGATVLRGLLGYGADRHLHIARLLDLSSGLPLVIEIVDSKKNLQKLLPFLEETIKDGFITMEKVHVVKYRRRPEPS